MIYLLKKIKSTCMNHPIFGWLVVSPTPLKNDGVNVSWDDDIPQKNGTIKFMFQITNQICIHFLTNPSLLTGTIFSNYPFSWVQVQTNLNSNPDFTKKWLWHPRISSQAGLTTILKGK